MFSICCCSCCGAAWSGVCVDGRQHHCLFWWRRRRKRETIWEKNGWMEISNIFCNSSRKWLKKIIIIINPFRQLNEWKGRSGENGGRKGIIGQLAGFFFSSLCNWWFGGRKLAQIAVDPLEHFLLLLLFLILKWTNNKIIVRSDA